MFRIDELTLRELAALLRRGRLTSVELVTHYLRRLDALNPALNAVVQRPESEALLEEARRADAELRADTVRGPLHGIPLTIKDACHVKGFRMSRGVAELQGEPSRHDATVVARLRAAGALVLGISNVPEFCMAFETDNLLYGATRNPHDPERSPGGSSGGEAAAIAAGCSPAGLASDACGSIRIPAHFCGVCGLKPTQWRVPLTGQYPNERSGVFHMISTFGALGRYIDDVALLGGLIAGGDGVDPDTVDVPWPDYRERSIAGMRVAICPATPQTMPTPPVRRALEAVAAQLVDQVAVVDMAMPPLLDQAFHTLWRAFVMGGDGGRGWRRLFDAIGKRDFSAPLEELLAHSEGLETSVDMLRADLNLMDDFRYQLARFFRDYDALICPVYPDVAFAPGESLLDTSAYSYVFPFSLSGSPVVALPVARHGNMPIAMQIVGRHWDEAGILALAAHLERALPRWEPAAAVAQGF